LGKTLNAVSHFGAKQSTRCGWSGMTDTEHSTTSSSKEEEKLLQKISLHKSLIELDFYHLFSFFEMVCTVYFLNKCFAKAVKLSYLDKRKILGTADSPLG